jgi:hypothetical protein
MWNIFLVRKDDLFIYPCNFRIYLNAYEDLILQYYNNKANKYFHINHWIKWYFYCQYIKNLFIVVNFFITMRKNHSLLNHNFKYFEKIFFNWALDLQEHMKLMSHLICYSYFMLAPNICKTKSMMCWLIIHDVIEWCPMMDGVGGLWFIVNLVLTKVGMELLSN